MASPKGSIDIDAGSRQLRFVGVGLDFLDHGLANVFAAKDNKSLGETIEHRRYSSLKAPATRDYLDFLSTPLGSFLGFLKGRGDPFYKRFLNPHGDETYCHFRMTECPEKRQKGLYLYALGNDVVYIGRSLHSFGKRVNQGYGKIHPKNCYIDGQSTNCHLNSLIESRSSSVCLYVCPLIDDAEIAILERTLIQYRRPAWNVALAK